jgi:hypothetical protein
LRANRHQPRCDLRATAPGFGDNIRIDETQSNSRAAAWRFRARIDGVDEGVIPSRV